MSRDGRTFEVRARGPLACFTRPEMKVERVSYEVMTPSAAIGLLKAVFWKPQMRWNIHQITVLNPVRWASFRRNEVGEVASPKKSEILIEEARQQRNTVALRDVDYVIRASIELEPGAGPDNPRIKYEEMFERRMKQGQHFQQPFLGCREFAADVLPAVDLPRPAEHDVDRPLGLMFYEFEWQRPDRSVPPRPLFFHARLRKGVLEVPTYNEVLRENRPS